MSSALLSQLATLRGRLTDFSQKILASLEQDPGANPLPSSDSDSPPPRARSIGVRRSKPAHRHAHRQRAKPSAQRQSLRTPVKAAAVSSSDDDEIEPTRGTEVLSSSDDSELAPLYARASQKVSPIAQKSGTLSKKSDTASRPFKATVAARTKAPAQIVTQRSPRPAKRSPRKSPVAVYFSAEGSALMGDSDEVKDVRAMLESSSDDDQSESASQAIRKGPPSDDSDDF
jgi:hypothetical protein